jgi:hypothetical protein
MVYASNLLILKVVKLRLNILADVFEEDDLGLLIPFKGDVLQVYFKNYCLIVRLFSIRQYLIILFAVMLVAVHHDVTQA